METTQTIVTNVAGIAQSPAFPHVLIRSVSRGYWGRGATIIEAIMACEWARSGDEVTVCRTDEGAYCDEVAGNLRYNARSPVYFGVINKRRSDVNITGAVVGMAETKIANRGAFPAPLGNIVD